MARHAQTENNLAWFPVGNVRCHIPYSADVRCDTKVGLACGLQNIYRNDDVCT
jgi:hypothetical protein